MPQIHNSTGHTKFDWPLTGRLRKDVDPALIGETNFRDLVNLRYTADGLKGVSGMTKNNTAALAETTLVNGHHFVKDSPSENHIFVQAKEGGTSHLYKSDNTADVPAQDTFSSYETLEDDSTVYFSSAPKGAMMAMNGSTNRIWAGNEDKCSKFIVYDPAGSFWYDYTDQVNNTLSDAKNIATMYYAGGGIDANTVTCLHFDNNVTDSELTPKTFTNVSVLFNTTFRVFGTHGAIFGGSAKVYTSDHADFDFSGGTFTIDARIRVTVTSNNPIYYQNTTSDADSFKFYVNTNGALTFDIKTTEGGTVLSLASPNGTIALNTWYYVSVVENGSDYYMFVGPNGGTAQLVAYTSSAVRCADYTGVINVGYGLTGGTGEYFKGYMDEFRVSKSARNIVAFNVPLVAYNTTASVCSVYVGSWRPLKGVKFYLKTANTSTATATAFEWNGSAWSELTVTDGTDTAGVTLAKDGEISFASTVSTSLIKTIKTSVCYFYQFKFVGIDVTTTVYRCTVDAPMQAITDIWDGTPRTCMQCYLHKASYSDITTNVLSYSSSNGKVYVASDTTTYGQVGGLTSSQYLYCGFDERVMGIIVDMPDSAYVNDATASISVDYWNGQAWVTVGSVDDSTLIGVKSLNHSGIWTWNVPTENTEFRTSVANNNQLYYYRVHFSGTLDADTRIFSITGIPAQKTITPYRFPLFWQERIWLFDNQQNARNEGICSAFGSNCVFNGYDSTPISFGNDTAVTCGETMFSRYSSSMYDNMVIFKKDATFLVDGTSPSTWQTFTISDKIGCVAPLTLKKCDMSYQVVAGITKHVLIWRSSRGIEFFDGNSLSCVSGDINNFFDSSSSDYIDPTVYNISAESSFYDEINYEYHYIFTNADGLQEWVYALNYKKWYQIDRGTGKALTCGFQTRDDYGTIYVYGGTGDGYIERLEYGNTFDSNSITYTVFLGDILLAKTATYVCKLRMVKLIARAKNISSATVACTHYADTCTTGTSLTAIPQTDSTHRLYQNKQSVNIDAVLHALKYEVTTSDETIGFEPLLVSGFFVPVREDI